MCVCVCLCVVYVRVDRFKKTAFSRSAWSKRPHKENSINSSNSNNVNHINNNNIKQFCILSFAFLFNFRAEKEVFVALHTCAHAPFCMCVCVYLSVCLSVCFRYSSLFLISLFQISKIIIIHLLNDDLDVLLVHLAVAIGVQRLRHLLANLLPVDFDVALVGQILRRGVYERVRKKKQRARLTQTQTNRDIQT